MTQPERDFLKILKNALHPSTEAETLSSPTDWEAVFSAAVRQNLLPLVYNAAAHCEGFDDFAAKQGGGYFTLVMRAVGNQIRRTDELLRLYPAFLKAGVQPIVLKGIVCRSLYGENADYRPSSDEDLWVEKENYQKAAAVLEQCGFEKKNPDADKDLNLAQDVAYKNYDSGFSIELHVNPFGFSNKLRVKIGKWFENAFQNTEWVEFCGVDFRTMSKTDNLLFLIFHAFKHFTSTGFGIRMITDVLLYMERFFYDINWDYIKTALQDVSALGFFGDLIAIGNKYLGFDLPQVARVVCPDDLLEDIFNTGTFGNINKANSSSYRFTSKALDAENKPKKSKLLDMWCVLFPSWETWKRIKPFLAKKPYLLPVEWAKRLFRYFKRKSEGTDVLAASYKIGQQRIELFEKYNII